MSEIWVLFQLPNFLRGGKSFILLCFPDGSGEKNSPANAVDVDSILGLGRPPEQGSGNPLQNFHLGNSTERGAWQATVHGGRKESDTTDLSTHT